MSCRRRSPWRTSTVLGRGLPTEYCAGDRGETNRSLKQQGQLLSREVIDGIVFFCRQGKASSQQEASVTVDCVDTAKLIWHSILYKNFPELTFSVRQTSACCSRTGAAEATGQYHFKVMERTWRLLYIAATICSGNQPQRFKKQNIYCFIDTHAAAFWSKTVISRMEPMWVLRPPVFEVSCNAANKIWNRRSLIRALMLTQSFVWRT